MDVHIARQPIFDSRKKIFAYELLLRQFQETNGDQLSGDRVTTNLLSSAFLTEDIERITGSKPCFINFSENLLLKELAPSFPKTKIIIDIPKEVSPSREVIAACRHLSEQGYILALDDFAYHTNLLPLIELANIIKIDCRPLADDIIERMLDHLARFSLKLLAEKIETHGAFEHARKLGFHYFQGYFFAEPESLRIVEIASNTLSLLNLLAEVNRPSTSLEKLEQIIASDVAISYKLLRYINSAFYSLLKEVNSIRQALIYLGEQEIRRFVTLVIVSELAADKPAELVRLSIIRARWCQLLAENSQRAQETGEFFLLGLFSLIDAILDKPKAQLMKMLPLSDQVREALTLQEGPFAPFLQAIITYEQGHSKLCLRHLREIRVDPAKMYDFYLEAVQFSSIVG